MKCNTSLLSAELLKQINVSKRKDREIWRITRILSTMKFKLGRSLETLQKSLYTVEKDVKHLQINQQDLTEAVARLNPFSRLQEDLMNEYGRRLSVFHEKTLQQLLHQQPVNHDVARYVKLQLCAGSIMFGHSDGIKAYVTDPPDIEENIELRDLFKENTPNGDPRTIVLAGVPGSGKTITCHYLLQQIITNELFKTSIKLTFLLKFREINEFKGLFTFKGLILNHHGPSCTELEQDCVWNYIAEHQEEVIFILDGYDEYEGLGNE